MIVTYQRQLPQEITAIYWPTFETIEAEVTLLPDRKFVGTDDQGRTWIQYMDERWWCCFIEEDGSCRYVTAR